MLDEIAEVLAPARPPRPVPGRTDAVAVEHAGRIDAVLGLRTAVAAFLALHLDVPRPRSLTSGDHLARIVAAMQASVRTVRSASFRFEAAGRDSAVYARLATLLAEATGLRYDEQEGELVVRVRRGTGPAGGDDDGRRATPRATAPAPRDPGWDVLVRIGPRPLSARAWRVVDYPGAANATIAAAMTRLAGVRPDDRVAALMCGSGTLLIERLLAGPARSAVAVDLAPTAMEACAANVEAAGLTSRVRLELGDATAPAWADATPDAGGAVGPGRGDGTRRGDGKGARWTEGGPFDLLLADPPWGTLHGSHAAGATLHRDLLLAAHAVAAPGARFAVLTHEIKVMERCLREADALWRVREEVRVFAKGHHPRIYVLART